MKKSFVLFSTLLFNACFDASSSSEISGVIITTNSGTSAKIKIFQEGHPEKALDSTQSRDGHFSFASPSQPGPYVLWASDGTLGGGTTLSTSATTVQIKLSDIRVITLDSAALMTPDSIIQGYAGSIQRTAGRWQIPLLDGITNQIWQSNQSNIQIQTTANSDSIHLSVQSPLGNKQTKINLKTNPPTIFVDSRDGQNYTTRQIGSQIWLKQNLTYNPPGQTTYCPSNVASNCNQYGRLYQWSQAKNICPKGTHLPSPAEFDTLVSQCGGTANAGPNLKSGLWNEGQILNTCGFEALAAGYVLANGGVANLGIDASFWSNDSLEIGNDARILYLHMSTQAANVTSNHRELFLSVRCILD